MKALVGASNQKKALVGAFSVIVQPVVEPMDRFAALVRTVSSSRQQPRQPVAVAQHLTFSGTENRILPQNVSNIYLVLPRYLTNILALWSEGKYNNPVKLLLVRTAFYQF